MKLFKEWEYKSPKIAGFLNKIQDEVHLLIPGAVIILYGSQARAEAKAESDWDLLILVDKKPPRELVIKVRDRLYELELESDTILSSIVRSRDEWNSDRYSALPFKKRVEREGIIL